MDICETFDPAVYKNVLPTLSIWALAIFGRFFPVSLIKACSIHGLAIQDAIFESCVFPSRRSQSFSAKRHVTWVITWYTVGKKHWQLGWKTKCPDEISFYRKTMCQERSVRKQDARYTTVLDLFETNVKVRVGKLSQGISIKLHLPPKNIKQHEQLSPSKALSTRGGGTQESLTRVGFTPRSNPLPLYNI